MPVFESGPKTPGELSQPQPQNQQKSRFASQNATAEDVLKEQTVGLVQLSDFRKRRAEAFEGRESELSSLRNSSASPSSAGETSQNPLKKKRKPAIKARSLLQLEDDADDSPSLKPAPLATKARSHPAASTIGADEEGDQLSQPRPGPKSRAGFAPRITTKAAAQQEADLRAQLAVEYQKTQALVKITDVSIPFVFFDGTNIPGGRCRVKKSDQIWLFLDKARKVGAELGLGGDKGKKDWARISVDDLMLVRDELILPHHLELYHFIINKTYGFKDQLFSYSDNITAATPKSLPEEVAASKNYNPLTSAQEMKAAALLSQHPEADLEGYNEDPTRTKVVDRRWFERNKHIFPMSLWEEYDMKKEYKGGTRKDAKGNSFFF